MDRQIAEVQALATKYSKAELGRMVKMGLLDPQKAMMAGMMIDRIQKQNAQPPQTTVAEDVFGAQQPQPQQQPQPMQQPAGLETLPADNIGEYAGGGIVAFADGGEADVPGYAGRDESWVIDPAVQRQRDMQWRLPILKQELQEAQARGSAADVAAVQREIRRLLPRAEADAGIGALIPAAQAAEPAATPMEEGTSSPLGRGVKRLFGMGEQTANKARAYQSGLETYDQRIAEIGNQIAELSGPLGMRQQTPEQRAEFEQLMKDRQVLLNARNNLARDIDKYSAIAPSKRPAATTTAPVPEAVPEGAPPAPRREGAPEEAPARQPKDEFAEATSGLKADKIPVPEKKTLKELAKEQEEAEALMGVDKEIFNKIRQDYKNMTGKFEDRRNKAAGMALAMTGLGLFTAREGQEAEALGKYGTQALVGFMGAMEKLNDNEDRLAEKLRDLDVAEQSYLRTKSEKALGEKRSLEREIRGVQSENAKLQTTVNLKAADLTIEWVKTNNPAMYQTLNRIAEDQRKAGNKGYTTLDALRDYQGIGKQGTVTRDQAYKAWTENIQLQAKYPDFEQYWLGYQRSMGGGGGGGAVDKSNPLLRQ